MTSPAKTLPPGELICRLTGISLPAALSLSIKPLAVVSCSSQAQISIYHPDVIVCCGTGYYISRIFESFMGPRLETSIGVGYWCSTAFGKKSFIIDYCHPSARVGSKLSGIVASDLADTIDRLMTTRV